MAKLSELLRMTFTDLGIYVARTGTGRVTEECSSFDRKVVKKLFCGISGLVDAHLIYSMSKDKVGFVIIFNILDEGKIEFSYYHDDDNYINLDRVTEGISYLRMPMEDEKVGDYLKELLKK